MAEDKENLEKFKEKYEKLRKKHNLCDFAFLNENFEIELIASEESDYILRRIRKVIVERIYSAMIKLEAFINPQNVSVFVFNIIKGFDANDKELISKLYRKFAEYEIQAFGLETKYSEKAEVEFIKKVCREWRKISQDLEKIHKSMSKSYDKSIKKQDKGYLG